jgi:peptidoglycan-associated lipoprotein
MEGTEVKRVMVAFLCVVGVGLTACAGSGTSSGLNNGTASNQGGGNSPGGRGPTPPVKDVVPSLGTVYFDYDDSALREDAKDALRGNAEYLRNVASAKIELQGNCDERGTEEYNLALGKRRAESAQQYLVDLGIANNRMTTVSFGEENPAVTGSSESAWAKNRRVDFVLR